MMSPDFQPSHEEAKPRFPTNIPIALSTRHLWTLQAESALRFILSARESNEEFSAGVIFNRSSLNDLFESQFLYPILDYMLSAVAADNDSGHDEAEPDYSLREDFSVANKDDDLEDELEEEPSALDQLRELALKHFPNIETKLLAAAMGSDGMQLLFVVFENHLDKALMLPGSREDGNADFSNSVLGSNSCLIGKIIEVAPKLQYEEFPEIASDSDFISQSIWEHQIRLLRAGEITPWFQDRMHEQSWMIAATAESFSVVSIAHATDNLYEDFSVMLYPDIREQSLAKITHILVKFGNSSRNEDPYYFIEIPIFFSDDSKFISEHLKLGEYDSAVANLKKNYHRMEGLSKKEKLEEVDIDEPFSKQDSLDLLCLKFGFQITNFSRTSLEDPDYTDMMHIFYAFAKTWYNDISPQEIDPLIYSSSDSPESKQYFLVLKKDSTDSNHEDLIIAADLSNLEKIETKPFGLHMTKDEYRANITAMLGGDFRSSLAKRIFCTGLKLSYSEFGENIETLSATYDVTLGFCPQQPGLESSRRLHLMLTEILTGDKSIVSCCFDDDLNFVPFIDHGTLEGIQLIAMHYDPES